MAVGYAQGGTSASPTYGLLSEEWDGTAWTVMPSPVGNTSAIQYLSSVSCLSPGWCMAVGTHRDATTPGTAYVWDGTTWSALTTLDNQVVSQLDSVSCVSTTFCMAIGVGPPNNGTQVE